MVCWLCKNIKKTQKEPRLPCRLDIFSRHKKQNCVSSENVFRVIRFMAITISLETALCPFGYKKLADWTYFVISHNTQKSEF